MIEVLVASIILAALVAMSSWLVWGSSKHVSRMEAEMSMDNGAREFITTLTKEIHQANMANIQWVDETKPIDATSTADTPGTLHAVKPPIWTPASPVPFTAIRFKIPGPQMEITSGNANPDKNDPLKKIDNFDLAKFKANADKPNYLYEIQYWWEIDNSNLKPEGIPGAGPNGFIPDGVDNNLNGVIDEGVIKKCEVWKDSLGNIQSRKISTVLRDVTSLQFTIPGVKWNGLDADGKPKWTGAAVTAGAEKIVTVSVTISRPDPTVHSFQDKLISLITKTFTGMIEVRNFE
jgi:hypothetical protein